MLFGQGILPLSEVRTGQLGTGKTVFQGSDPQDFQVEILGVLENIGPRQNIILARLSGGPLEKTGVMQGMSGSPVYIDGKLVGAVALAFPFSKDPIAGIRPIEEMLDSNPPRAVAAAPVAKLDGFGGAKLVEVATPVSFSGFTRRAVEHFAPEWRKLGLEPLQGIGGRASVAGRGSQRPLEPGSMLSVQLISGDLSVGADGTVTMIDGSRVYAFGHRLLGLGSAELPFSRSEVITLLPSLSSSFKISAGGELLGTITQDGNAAISGDLRRRAATVPVKIDVAGAQRKASYRMDVISHPVLTPFLLQMALFSAIDGTERTLGSSTVSISGEIRFDGGLPPLKIHQSIAGDFNAPVIASLASTSPLALLLQGASDPVRLSGIDLTVTAAETRRLWQIEHVSSSRKQVRAGDPVRISVVLTGAGGKEAVLHADYSVPVGTPAGMLSITAADAINMNLADNRLGFSAFGRPARQILDQMNDLRPNSSAWVRIWRPEPTVQVGGTDYPNLPAGLTLLLSREPSQIPATALGGSKLFEAEMPFPDAVVAGLKTIQMEVLP